MPDTIVCDPWTRFSPTTTTWHVRGLSAYRITESGALRLTESGNDVRIVEHCRVTSPVEDMIRLTEEGLQRETEDGRLRTTE